MRALSRTGAFVAGIALIAMLAGAQPASAYDPRREAITEFIEATVRPWMSDPIVIAAIKAQNAAHAGLAVADIMALDRQWQHEVAAKVRPMIDAHLASPLSLFLRARQKAAGGLITEIFVMDSRGLNVGQSDVTSDYWQGDEEKWQKSFGAGRLTPHIEATRQDASTQMNQAQASLAIADPATGTLIGAITIGINLDAL